ncbi:hypothetical protein P8C59_002755 [Phyllachora maydis]|uniref:Oxo-4-hydroxy-4-carboxy-5-ureidoimidazoline decarboxylase domain-containing protein n=1 Tax=Phyllachora maydis TaxID=1825666 RepID=A0AAD9I089_9PEZI|nr:hypothetical protein P8C59_002755 [Phyllachora maydis]
MPPLDPPAAPFLPAPTSLPTVDDAALGATLDLLFEPSTALHALAVPTLRTTSFASWADVVDGLRAQLLALAAAVPDDDEARAPLYAILGAHPRLGEPRTGPSTAEQAGLRGGAVEEVEEEGRRLAALNQEYEARFPGLRFVVFVNGRGRREVMADMRRRIDRGDRREEVREAIRAMCDIALDRAGKLPVRAGEEAVAGGEGERIG